MRSLAHEWGPIFVITFTVLQTCIVALRFLYVLGPTSVSLEQNAFKCLKIRIISFLIFLQTKHPDLIVCKKNNYM